MNIFELLFLLGWIACGVAGSLLLKQWGLPAEIVGFGGGIVLSFGVFRLLNFAVDAWIPETPKCQCGISGDDTYKFQEWREDENGAIVGGIYECPRCGRQYLKTQRKFDEVLEDGTTRPYKMHYLFGRWRTVPLSRKIDSCL